MKYLKHRFCPVCSGELYLAKLACRNCKAEFPTEYGLSPYDKLSKEQGEFLFTFLKARGNIKEVCEETKMSYPTVKKRLEQLLAALGIESQKEEMEIEMGSMNNLKTNSNKASDIIQRKLYDAGGKVSISLLDGKLCTVILTEGGTMFASDKLGNQKYHFDIFDTIIDLLLSSKDGKAPKGCGHNKEDKVGYGKCTPDTVMGAIAINYFKKNYGDSTFDPVFVLAAILDWAGIAKNQRGSIQLIKK